MIKKRKIFIIVAVILSLCAVGTAKADFVYRINTGETLGGIAGQYGMTLDTLMGNNQYITDPDMVYAGQVLVVPGYNKRAYVVEPGDTLFTIAEGFGVTIKFLAFVNRLEDMDMIYAGQTLMIPETYTVEAGDTLTTIALKLGVAMDDLAVENDLEDINTLYVGQPLIIPFREIAQEDLEDVDHEMAPYIAKFPDTFFYKGQSGSKRIALTFDDGPGQPITPEVLDILKAYGVRATFFMLGMNVQGHEELLKRAVREGHVIANHTWTHPDLTKCAPEQLANEMNRMNDEVMRLTGHEMVMMRPPYGYVTDENIVQLGDMGYKIIKWSIDSFDWRDVNVDQMLINTIPDIRDGSIILMHDGSDYLITHEMLPELIESLLYQGYNFVTVDEMLGIEAYS